MSELEEAFGLPPRQVHALVEIALLKGLASALPIKKISVDKESVSVTYTDAAFMTGGAMKNSLALLSGDLRETSVSGLEARYAVKGGVPAVKVRTLIRFMKALAGDIVTTTKE